MPPCPHGHPRCSCRPLLSRDLADDCGCTETVRCPRCEARAKGSLGAPRQTERYVNNPSRRRRG